MTQLSDAQVADCCRHGGFTGDELGPAIACALATSGGVASYEYVIPPGPVAHYKGLFGIDVVDHAHLAQLDLTNPYENAEAARLLTLRHASFDWCPAYRTDAWAPYLTRALAAANRLPNVETQRVPIHLDTHRAARTQQQLASTSLYNALTDGRRRRR